MALTGRVRIEDHEARLGFDGNRLANSVAGTDGRHHDILILGMTNDEFYDRYGR